jgi:putative DNA primase/helicase
MNSDRPIDIVIARLEARGMNPRGAGPGQWKSRCPVHKGDGFTLSIREEQDGTVLLHCHHVDAGRRTCSAKDIAEELDMQFRDLFPARLGSPRPKTAGSKPKPARKRSQAHRSPEDAIAGVIRHYGKPTKDWTYHRVHEGQRFEILRVYRFDLGDGSKEFRPVHHDPSGWILGDPPGKLPLYNLPELDGDDPVFVAEGEKCVDLLRGIGLAATTSAHGAKSPQKSEWSPLAGKTVIILPDHDEPGKIYAESVASILANLDPRPDIRIVELPGARKGDDVEQWLESLPDSWSDAECRAELERLWRPAPLWAPPPSEPDTKTCQGPGEDGFNLTELGNSQRLIRTHGDRIRFCHSRGIWLTWDGRRWATDAKGHIWRFMKEVVRQLGHEAAEAKDVELRERTYKWAIYSERKKVLQASMDLAFSEEVIAIVAEDMDRDPWLLNCPNGTIDLRTGELRSHRQEDLLSKLASCNYDPDAECPRWKEALGVIFDGDEELIAYVKRALGYSMTGDVSAQSLFLCYGTGRNGKNTVLDTVRSILKDYATVAAPRILLTAGQNDHPAMIADLLGARFVPTSEVDEGERLAESLVKRLTGDSTIKARFMHQNPFEFKITFKLWMAVNSKPEISGTDKGIWSRIKVIPFDTFIPPERRIPNLSDILIREEAPGILAWLVQGCLEWQGAGLMEPPRVLDAIKNYQSEQDVFGDFLAERVVDHTRNELLRDKARVKADDLYACYMEWCRVNGIKLPLTARKFSLELTKRGFPSRSNNGRNYRYGMELTQDSGSSSIEERPY